MSKLVIKVNKESILCNVFENKDGFHVSINRSFGVPFSGFGTTIESAIKDLMQVYFYTERRQCEERYKPFIMPKYTYELSR